MKNRKLFSTLTALTVGAFTATGLVVAPSIAFADHHEGAGEKSCSGKGEKSCSGKDDHDHDDHEGHDHHDDHGKGEKACSGEKGCGGSK